MITNKYIYVYYIYIYIMQINNIKIIYIHCTLTFISYQINNYITFKNKYEKNYV